jgi:PAS domain S-box-containing protein
MLKRPPLVWKVNGVFLAILVCVLGASALVTHLLHEQTALESAHDVSRVSASIIVQDIHELMVMGASSEVDELLERLSMESPVYRDIRLITHDGQVVASALDPPSALMDEAAWPCAQCHGIDASAPDTTAASFETILEAENGSRFVSVATPVFRDPRCATAECHADPETASTLGVLQVDFSLAGVEDHIATSARHIAIALVLSILAGAIATWWMTDRLVGRRLRVLREGAQHLADHDFTFRFSDDRGDRISQVEGILDNVTSELSSTLSELISTKEHLQGIVESSGDIIITVDPFGLITTFNRGAEEILGYSRQEVIGKHIETLFADPRERDAAIKQLQHTDQVVNYQTHFLTKDHEVRNVILTLSRLRAPDGKPLGTFGISKDVTKELQLQREVLRSARMAALGQALTGIQHSMKNMLNVLKGGSYMVKTALAKDDRQMLAEGWDMVQQGIARMTEMSRSMLDFARERPLKLKPTDLGALARHILALNNGKFSEQGITLELEVAPNVPDIECDPDLIHSVIMDLLSNALYACSEKQYRDEETPSVTLEVQVGEVEGYVSIVVSDNAEGMPEEIRRKVFTPFFSTKKQKGTGMGLAVVARIVSSHGGMTRVESEPGLGSTFEVLLPIAGPSVREEGADV